MGKTGVVRDYSLPKTQVSYLDGIEKKAILKNDAYLLFLP